MSTAESLTTETLLANAVSRLAGTEETEQEPEWVCPKCGLLMKGNDAKNHYCTRCKKFYPLPDDTFADDPTKPNAAVDHTLPSARWSFDGDVTRVFDDMLERSIPDYEGMRRLVTKLAFEYVQPDTTIVDLGCSRGEALAPFVQKFGAYNTYVGVDVSEPMLLAARERFAGAIRAGSVRILNHDLRSGYPPAYASVTLAVLTLQFVPIEYRFALMSDIYARTLPGGALIMVEKVLGDTAQLDGMMVKHYLQLKREHGYSEEEIERKRMALEGVLVPMTAHWNKQMLRTAGFEQIDCFWRNLNFAGFIALRRGGTIRRHVNLRGL